MLSPATQEIKNIFPKAKISLITWIPTIINFNGIEFVPYQKEKIKQEKFDLLISPTLNLHHLPFIFSAKYWVGYFAKERLQANFKIEKCDYDPQNEHYFWRSVCLIKSLNKESGQKLQELAQKKRLSYPEIKVGELKDYQENELLKSRYLAVAVFSKIPDRLWPIEKYAQVIEQVYNNKYVEKIVLLGDDSKNNAATARKLIDNLTLPKTAILNLTGQCSLSQAAYIIKNSYLFLGADSGPAHLAYFLAKKPVAIFITVEPNLRLPLFIGLDKIKTVYPFPSPPCSLYNGLMPVPEKVVKQYKERITVDDVLKKFAELVKF